MSAAQLRTVHLHGHLAEEIGSTIKLAFNTPVEAVRLLELNFPGFMGKLREGYYKVTALRGPERERTLGVEGLQMGFTGDLSIMPVMGGSGDGGGFVGVVLGAAIVGAALFFSGGTLAAALPGFMGSTLGLTYGTLAQLGVGLALTGVAQMLTPTPTTDYSSVDENASFVFNGPVNLTQPGGVVPLIYGAMFCGTYNVSAALDVEMILGGNVPEVKASRFGIGRSNKLAYVDLDDLITIVDGSTLISVAGVDVTGGPVVITGGEDLSITVDNSKTDDLIVLDYLGDASTAKYSTAIPYEIENGGTVYEGTFTFSAGGLFSTIWAPVFGAFYEENIEVTGVADA